MTSILYKLNWVEPVFLKLALHTFKLQYWWIKMWNYSKWSRITLTQVNVYTFTQLQIITIYVLVFEKKNHLPRKSVKIPSGITSIATIKSVMASDIKK